MSLCEAMALANRQSICQASFVFWLLGTGDELCGIHGTEKEARDNLWHANSVKMSLSIMKPSDWVTHRSRRLLTSEVKITD